MRRSLFYYPLILAFLLMTSWSCPSGSKASDCRGLSSLISADDLSRVLFVVSAKDSQHHEEFSDAGKIKNDIVAMLSEAGISSEIREQKEAVRAKRYLKVHIYSIVLERQVYFCSVEVMRQRPSREEDCPVLEYSNITSQVSSVRGQVKDLLKQVIGEVVPAER